MRHEVALWLTLLAGPVVWFISLCGGFALSPWTCNLGWKPGIYGLFLAGLLITTGLALMAWRHWRQVGRELPGEMGGAIAGRRAIASGAVVLNAMFFLVILAQGIALSLLSACT